MQMKKLRFGEVFGVSFVFSGPYPQHMRVPRLGDELELQLLAYATSTTTQYPSRIFDLHHSSWQCQILNPLSKARDRTHNLMVPSGIRFCCATTGSPVFFFFFFFNILFYLFIYFSLFAFSRTTPAA